MARARIWSWICLTFTLPLASRTCSLIPASTSHLCPRGWDSGPDRAGFSWNCGCWTLLTNPEMVLDYFRSRIISLPQVIFLLSACPSRMKGVNIKELGAALY